MYGKKDNFTIIDELIDVILPFNREKFLILILCYSSLILFILTAFYYQLSDYEYLGGGFSGNVNALIINPIFYFVTIIIYLKISRFFGRYPTMFEKWISKGFKFMIIGEVLLIFDRAISYSIQRYLSHYIYLNYNIMFHNIFNSIFLLTSIIFHCFILYGLYLIIIGLAYYGLEPTSDEFKNLKIGYKYRNLKNPFIPLNLQRIIIILTGMSFSIIFLVIQIQGILQDTIELNDVFLYIQFLSSTLFLVLLYLIIVIITLYYYKISEFFYEGKNKFELNFSSGFKFIVIGMVLYFIVAAVFSPTIIIHFLGLELYSKIYEEIAYVRGILNIIFNILIVYGIILLARATRYYRWKDPFIKDKKINTKLKTSTTFKFKNLKDN